MIILLKTALKERKMGSQNRSKKPTNYGAIHITDLDDDFDELTLFDDSNSKKKEPDRPKLGVKPPSKGTSGAKSSTIEKPHSVQIKPDIKMKESLERSVLPSGNKPNRTGKFMANIESPNSARSVLSNQSESKPTQRGALLTPITQSVTSSRSNTTTPLNQRTPVSVVQITKRYTGTPQNKNTKGIGHEVNDMFIDDIEDF